MKGDAVAEAEQGVLTCADLQVFYENGLIECVRAVGCADDELVCSVLARTCNRVGNLRVAEGVGWGPMILDASACRRGNAYLYKVSQANVFGVKGLRTASKHQNVFADGVQEIATAVVNGIEGDCIIAPLCVLMRWRKFCGRGTISEVPEELCQRAVSL